MATIASLKRRREGWPARGRVATSAFLRRRKEEFHIMRLLTEGWGRGGRTRARKRERWRKGGGEVEEEEAEE